MMPYYEINSSTPLASVFNYVHYYWVKYLFLKLEKEKPAIYTLNLNKGLSIG